jgi:hypothetical protein
VKHVTRSAVCLLGFILMFTFTGWSQATPDKVDAVVTADDENGSVALKRPEQIALMFVVAISSLEDDCKRHAEHVCTLDELIAGPKSKDKDWPIGKLKFDPNKSDPNYEYKVAAAGDKWEIWANPKKAGLGGFYFKSGGFIADKYYNPSGPATAKSKQLSGYSVSGDSFKTD